MIIGGSSLSWAYHNTSENNNRKHTSSNVHTVAKTSSLQMIYDSLHLNELGLSDRAFEYAIKGYEKLLNEGELKNTSVITIVDFDQPSYKKRMYVIDVVNHKVLFNTWSAHGKSTGLDVAENFSNKPQSNKSSLGFYVTNDTYYGSKGYSLRLTGLEQNINNNASGRAIVLHGANYVSQSLINAQGYIGRSLGCPAVPIEMNRPIIDKIKNGSLLFIYNKSYKPSKKFQVG